VSDRDNQFEVQYVLSLLIVSIGVLRIDSVRRQSLDLALIGLVFTGAFHLVVSNLTYVYESVARYESPLATTLSEWSRWTIILVTVVFVWAFLHGVLTPVAELLPKSSLFGGFRWREVISLGVPTTVVVAMGAQLKKWLRNTLGFSRDISIRTSPDTLHVYDDFDETEPVLVEIENDGETGYEFDVQITPPPGTYLKIGDKTEDEKFTSTEEVAAGQRWSESFELQHLGDAGRGLLKIEIRHPSGVYSQEIRCLPR
jgi:hypothetical protein